MPMKLTVKDIKGNAAGDLEVGFAVIEDSKGLQAVHDAVVAYRANQRAGTACTKTRAEVAGSGRKPWRQKGTGRARVGSVRSPIWRGGGVVFGPRPRDFGKKLTKATKVLALRKALSERLKAGDVVVVDELNLAAPKTREFVGLMNTLELDGTTLVVTEGGNYNLLLSARNVPHVEVTTGDALTTYQVLNYDKLLFSRSAFNRVDERLK